MPRTCFLVALYSSPSLCPCITSVFLVISSSLVYCFSRFIIPSFCGSTTSYHLLFNYILNRYFFYVSRASITLSPTTSPVPCSSSIFLNTASICSTLSNMSFWNTLHVSSSSMHFTLHLKISQYDDVFLVLELMLVMQYLTEALLHFLTRNSSTTVVRRHS